jgi:hypothetical protein
MEEQQMHQTFHSVKHYKVEQITPLPFMQKTTMEQMGHNQVLRLTLLPNQFQGHQLLCQLLQVSGW